MTLELACHVAGRHAAYFEKRYLPHLQLLSEQSQAVGMFWPAPLWRGGGARPLLGTGATCSLRASMTRRTSVACESTRAQMTHDPSNTQQHEMRAYRVVSACYSITRPHMHMSTYAHVQEASMQKGKHGSYASKQRWHVLHSLMAAAVSQWCSISATTSQRGAAAVHT